MPSCVIGTDLISPWTVVCDCPCYQPTPLVASIGRNEAAEEVANLRQPWKVSDVLSGPKVQCVRYVNVVDADDHLIGFVDSRVAAKVCAVEEMEKTLEDAYRSLITVSMFGYENYLFDDGDADGLRQWAKNRAKEAGAALAKARGET